MALATSRLDLYVWRGFLERLSLQRSWFQLVARGLFANRRRLMALYSTTYSDIGGMHELEIKRRFGGHLSNIAHQRYYRESTPED